MIWRKVGIGHYRAETPDGEAIYHVVRRSHSTWALREGHREINHGFSKGQMQEAAEKREKDGVRRQKELRQAEEVRREKALQDQIDAALRAPDTTHERITMPTSIRMTGVTRKMLDALADEYGITRTKVIARLIREAHTRLHGKS